MWQYHPYYYQHHQGDMMHVVPNSLQSATDSEQLHPLTACLSPEYSAPSSPFDFDIDFLINDCVSVPQQQQQPLATSNSLSATVDNSDADSGINLEGSSCFNQVPNSPAFSLTDSVDSALSPAAAMFSPSSGGSSNNSDHGMMGSYEQQHQLVTKQSAPKQWHQHQAHSPYSSSVPGSRPFRRLSSTGSSGMSLQDSLIEYDQVQQKVKLEQEMTQISIPPSLMVTPVNPCPPPPPLIAPAAPAQPSMATITKVTTSPPQQQQQQQQQQQPLLRQVLESRQQMFQPPLPLPPPLPASAPQKDSSSDLVNQAMEQYRKDIEATCMKLNISQDPINWTIEDVNKWTSFYQLQYNIVTAFRPFGLMDGRAICQLPEDNFSRMFPERGQLMYSQLEIWRATAATTPVLPPSPQTVVKTEFKTEAPDESDISSILDMLEDIQPPPALPVPPVASCQQAIMPATVATITPSLTITPSASFGKPPPPSYQETMNSQYNTASSSLTISPVVTPKTTISFSAAATVTTLEQPAAAAAAMAVFPPPPAYPGPSALEGPSTTTTVIKKEYDQEEEEDEDEDGDSKSGKKSGSNIMLWQFLKELLLQPESYSGCIHWLDREKGVFKIVDSVRVATLWGQRKNRPAMNYDKLSRSLRQYYKKGKMKKTEKTQRLVYQFCEPYHL